MVLRLNKFDLNNYIDSSIFISVALQVKILIIIYSGIGHKKKASIAGNLFLILLLESKLC